MTRYGCRMERFADDDRGYRARTGQEVALVVGLAFPGRDWSLVAVGDYIATEATRSAGAAVWEPHRAAWFGQVVQIRGRKSDGVATSVILRTAPDEQPPAVVPLHVTMLLEAREFRIERDDPGATIGQPGRSAQYEIDMHDVAEVPTEGWARWAAVSAMAPQPAGNLPWWPRFFRFLHSIAGPSVPKVALVAPNHKAAWEWLNAAGLGSIAIARMVAHPVVDASDVLGRRFDLVVVPRDLPWPEPHRIGGVATAAGPPGPLQLVAELRNRAKDHVVVLRAPPLLWMRSHSRGEL